MHKLIISPLLFHPWKDLGCQKMPKDPAKFNFLRVWVDVNKQKNSQKG